MVREFGGSNFRNSCRLREVASETLSPPPSTTRTRAPALHEYQENRIASGLVRFADEVIRLFVCIDRTGRARQVGNSVVGMRGILAVCKAP